MKKEKEKKERKGKKTKKNTDIFNWVLKANRDREKQKREELNKGNIKTKKRGKKRGKVEGNPYCLTHRSKYRMVQQ